MSSKAGVTQDEACVFTRIRPRSPMLPRSAKSFGRLDDRGACHRSELGSVGDYSRASQQGLSFTYPSKGICKRESPRLCFLSCVASALNRSTEGRLARTTSDLFRGFRRGPDAAPDTAFTLTFAGLMFRKLRKYKCYKSAGFARQKSHLNHYFFSTITPTEMPTNSPQVINCLFSRAIVHLALHGKHFWFQMYV